MMKGGDASGTGYEKRRPESAISCDRGEGGRGLT